MGNVFAIRLTRPVEQLLNTFMQVALIAFETQYMVCTLVDNELGALLTWLWPRRHEALAVQSAISLKITSKRSVAYTAFTEQR
jgi:hypothetical protein